MQCKAVYFVLIFSFVFLSAPFSFFFSLSLLSLLTSLIPPFPSLIFEIWHLAFPRNPEDRDPICHTDASFVISDRNACRWRGRGSSTTLIHMMRKSLISLLFFLQHHFFSVFLFCRSSFSQFPMRVISFRVWEIDWLAGNVSFSSVIITSMAFPSRHFPLILWSCRFVLPVSSPTYIQLKCLHASHT